MAVNTIDQEFLKKLDEIVNLLTQNGGLLALGSNQCGKSNAIMWILRRIRDTKDSKVTIFDTCLNWRYNFDKVPFIDRSLWLGELPITRDLIVDLTDPDPLIIKTSIAEIINVDYEDKRRLKESLNGQVPYINYYVIEEMQNVFGTTALGQSSGRFIYKTICDGTNFGMCFIGLGQRLAEISTKIAERRRYLLLGRANGDNDLEKIKRTFNAEVAQKVSQLVVDPAKGICQFVFYDKATSDGSVITFPKFQQTGKPEPIATADLSRGNVQKLKFHRRF
jgi:hypothetical protein